MDEVALKMIADLAPPKGKKTKNFLKYSEKRYLDKVEQESSALLPQFALDLPLKPLGLAP